MKIKTSELTDRALDWAVAKCENYPVKVANGMILNCAKFSTDWSQGGPIIEREGIGFHRNGVRTFSNEAMRYQANLIRNQDEAPMLRVGYRGTGPTPLIAAMRCYCASKLGEEVDVPDELL